MPPFRAWSMAILDLLGATGVLGGSSIWEIKLNHAQHVIQHESVPVDSAGYALVHKGHPAIESIKKRSQHRKRWIAEEENVGNRGKKWPAKTVPYCWENPVGKLRFQGHFLEALKLWDEAGLRRDVYRFVETADAGDACTQHNARSQILVIRVLSSLFYITSNDATVGKQGASLMRIGPSGGREPTVRDIAHEIGHVWGLDHEMQHMGFWSRPYNNEFPGHVFGDNFRCNNIFGYSKAVRKAAVKGVTPEQLCTDAVIAEVYGFTASEIVHEMPILLRNDGLPFYHHPRPSQGDVHGVRSIYDEPLEDIEQAPFPGLPNALPPGYEGFWKNKVQSFKDHMKQALGCGSS